MIGFALLQALIGVAPLTAERLEARIVEIGAPPETAFEIRVAFHDQLLARKKLEIWTSERESWQRVIGLDEARFGEGVIAERDLIRARIEGGLLDLEVAEARLALARARDRLGELLGQGGVELDLSEADFDEKLAPLDRNQLPSGRSDVAAAAEEYEIARERIQTYRLRLLSSADESLAIEELLYEQLKTGLVTLLEARRTRLSIELGYVETLYRAAVARLRLQHVLGRKDLPT